MFPFFYLFLSPLLTFWLSLSHSLSRCFEWICEGLVGVREGHDEALEVSEIYSAIWIKASLPPPPPPLQKLVLADGTPPEWALLILSCILGLATGLLCGFVLVVVDFCWLFCGFVVWLLVFHIMDFVSLLWISFRCGFPVGVLFGALWIWVFCCMW